MSRLLVHVEGQTEETFVNEMLRDHLFTKGYQSVSARLLGNARQRHRRGGICPWPAAKRDILIHLKQDQSCIVTTMVDYYALPQQGEGAWPGRAEATYRSHVEKARFIEEALQRDIAGAVNPDLLRDRFVPFVIMHEFEALLFSDCAAFSRAIGKTHLEEALAAIRAKFNTPEEINDSFQTAPSRRLQALMPTYEKPLLGVIAALEIGLASIRRECPHFDAWLTQLERRVDRGL